MKDPRDEHTCSYHCRRLKCIEAQRDELRDKMDKLIAEAVAAEREACAKVCEEQKFKYEKRASEPEQFQDINPEVARIAGMTCDFNAAKIRARGEK